jgi:DNA-binding HxlR family transcriptional regulator
MFKYGQYCPIAMAVEILGDRWTLLIVRDLMSGTRRFNDLERGLPGISRALLAARLRRLQGEGIIDKRALGRGRVTEYSLTPAGRALQPVIFSLMEWGAHWAFGAPRPDQLDPVLLLWWMRGRVCLDQLPPHRVVIQFDFGGATTARYWLVLAPDDASVCLTHPGYDIDVLVTADLATYFQVWLGRIGFSDAVRECLIKVEATPALERAFPTWFAWSLAAPTIRAVTASAQP